MKGNHVIEVGEPRHAPLFQPAEGVRRSEGAEARREDDHANGDVGLLLTPRVSSHQISQSIQRFFGFI